MDYKPSMISAFESGTRRMKIEDLMRACIVLDKSPDYFLGDMPAATPESVGLSLRADLATLPGDELASSIGSLLEEIEADLPSGGGVVDLGELRPEAAAREVLHIAGVTGPEVDMEAVCGVIGIPIYRRPLPESLSAAVMSIGADAFVIAVNSGQALVGVGSALPMSLAMRCFATRPGYYLESPPRPWAFASPI